MDGVPLICYVDWIRTCTAAVRPDTERKCFEQDPIPNRHAALHGLVIYSSMQNSLNSIFMTEFIFQVISALKRTARMQATS